MADKTIPRADLVRIIEDSLPGDCAQSTRDGLRRVAATTDAVAVGWFHCGDALCPMRQVRRRSGNQAFQTAFDQAMAEYFGVDPGEVSLTGGSFVARVSDAARVSR